MKSNITIGKIFQCLVGVGFGLVIPAAFFLTIIGGILQFFTIDKSIIIFIAYLTVFFYLAWIGGGLTCEIEDFNCAVRGVLSSFFINVFSCYFYRNLITFKYIHIFVLIIMLNCLIAIYGCQICEKYIHKKKLEDLSGKGNLIVIVLGLPIPFFTFVWIFLLVTLKLMALL